MVYKLSSLKKCRFWSGVILIFMMVVLGVVVVCLLYFSTESFPEVSVKKITQKNLAQHYSIDVEYPVLSGMSDLKIQKIINLDIFDAVSKIQNGFIQDVAQTNPYNIGDENTLLVRYETFALSRRVASFEIEISEYNIGAAHPGDFIETLNYDLLSGHLLALGDIFQPQSPYLSRVSEISIANLSQQLGRQGLSDWQQEGARPVAENYQNFVLTDSALVIIFNPYQVAPSAAGILQVIIPYAQLKNIINVGRLFER